ncbi:MAG: AAA family ATPase, partial [Planctomycetota bacterium]
DGKGRRVRFDRALVVMTSNCGAEDVQAAARAVGFHRQESVGRASVADITDEALSRTFSPEFLGRIGEIVYFDELGPEVVEGVAAKHLAELQERAERRGFRVRFTPAVARWVARHGYRPESGARELRRVVQREIEPRLSELLLSGGAATVRIKGGELRFD